MKVQIAVLLVAVIAGVAVLGLYASGLRVSVTVESNQSSLCSLENLRLTLSKPAEETNLKVENVGTVNATYVTVHSNLGDSTGPITAANVIKPGTSITFNMGMSQVEWASVTTACGNTFRTA